MVLFASAVTSPKVPVGMATTTTNSADEMHEIRYQREDEPKTNGGITARYLAMCAPMYNWFWALYENFRNHQLLFIYGAHGTYGFM